MTAHLVCVRCGNPLRGLRPDGQCPTCGHAVSTRPRTAKREEWNDLIGLRRALVHSLLFGLLIGAGVLALLWVSKPALEWLAVNDGRGRFTVMAMGAAGIGVGLLIEWLLWHRMTEAAGFTGGILLVITLTTIVLSVGAGAWCAVNIIGAPQGPVVYFALATILGSSIESIYECLSD